MSTNCESSLAASKSAIDTSSLAMKAEVESQVSISFKELQANQKRDKH